MNWIFRKFCCVPCYATLSSVSLKRNLKNHTLLRKTFGNWMHFLKTCYYTKRSLEEKEDPPKPLVLLVLGAMLAFLYPCSSIFPKCCYLKTCF